MELVRRVIVDEDCPPESLGYPLSYFFRGNYIWFNVDHKNTLEQWDPIKCICLQRIEYKRTDFMGLRDLNQDNQILWLVHSNTVDIYDLNARQLLYTVKTRNINFISNVCSTVVWKSKLYLLDGEQQNFIRLTQIDQYGNIRTLYEAALIGMDLVIHKNLLWCNSSTELQGYHEDGRCVRSISTCPMIMNISYLCPTVFEWRDEIWGACVDGVRCLTQPTNHVYQYFNVIKNQITSLAVIPWGDYLVICNGTHAYFTELIIHGKYRIWKYVLKTRTINNWHLDHSGRLWLMASWENNVYCLSSINSTTIDLQPMRMIFGKEQREVFSAWIDDKHCVMIELYPRVE